jgi:hypothetical protein
MVSVLALSVVDHGFDPGSSQTRDYKIGICCFSPKQAFYLLDTTLCDKVHQLLATGWWFSTGTLVSSTNKKN